MCIRDRVRVLPARTGSGPSVLVTRRSAWALTVVVVVSLFEAPPTVGSAVVVVALAVLVRIVPWAVPEATVAAMITVLVAPAAIVASETLPVQAVLGEQLTPVVTQYCSPVSSVGRTSLSETPRASDGPRLSTVIVEVRVLPARAGSGPSVLVTRRSAWALTVVVVVSLFEAPPTVGSAVVVVALAVLVRIVPWAVPEATVAAMITVLVAPAAIVASETLPVQAVLGEQLTPVVTQYCSPVSAVGRTWLSETPRASDGPRLSTVIV